MAKLSEKLTESQRIDRGIQAANCLKWLSDIEVELKDESWNLLKASKTDTVESNVEQVRLTILGFNAFRIRLTRIVHDGDLASRERELVRKKGK